MKAVKTKILFGAEMKYSGFGLRGHSKGMYSGGFGYYVFGIKGVIGIIKYIAWGDFCRDNPNLK